MKNKIFITVFIILLFLPLFDNAFNIAPIDDLFEKKAPSAIPNLPKNLDDLDQFPKKFNKYYDDNYGFRKSLILLHSQMLDKIFNQSPDDRVLKGRDGWLFFDNKSSFLDALGRASLEQKLIEKSIDVFYQNYLEAKKRSMKYLLVIAADKINIYSEFLPDSFNYVGLNRINVFKKALLKKYPDFPIIDLKEIMLKAKENEIIYHKTDTHWNKRGAHYAYVEILKRLGLKPYLRDKFIAEEGQYFGDIAQILGIKMTNIDYKLQKNFVSKIQRDDELLNNLKDFHKADAYKNTNQNLPRLFVYKDSFFNELKHLVSEHFSSAIYVNEFPCSIDYDILQNYSPDYVIQQFWENRIESILNEC